MVFAADIKSLPNQAGNGDIDLAGNAFVNANEIQEILGAPMSKGYVVVSIKVSPRTIQAIRISPDDFTLVSRKDGERSPALAPSQIAGSASLVLRSGSSRSGGGLGTAPARPSLPGIPGRPGGIGTAAGVESGTVEATPGETKKGPENPLLKILESKILPDTETKEPVEGLLYFLMEGKNKPKDLGLLYKGPAGRLAMDFK